MCKRPSVAGKSTKPADMEFEQGELGLRRSKGMQQGLGFRVVSYMHIAVWLVGQYATQGGALSCSAGSRRFLYPSVKKHSKVMAHVLV